MNNSYSPFFSFILPAYKARYLDKSIESILSQTHKDFELVIVNDKSPQHLEVLINHYHDFRISYYENESNIGRKNLVAQWNRCLSYAKGEYIILASDDDVYDFRYLEEIYKLILKYPTCHVFRSRIALIDGSGEVFRKEQIIDEYLTFEDFFSAFVNGKLFSGVPFYCFQKKALMKGGGIHFHWHGTVMISRSLNLPKMV